MGIWFIVSRQSRSRGCRSHKDNQPSGERAYHCFNKILRARGGTRALGSWLAVHSTAVNSKQRNSDLSISTEHFSHSPQNIVSVILARMRHSLAFRPCLLCIECALIR